MIWVAKGKMKMGIFNAVGSFGFLAFLAATVADLATVDSFVHSPWYVVHSKSN
jgi:hypothetical protein